jgi:hypothetical protein
MDNFITVQVLCSSYLQYGLIQGTSQVNDQSFQGNGRVTECE